MISRHKAQQIADVSEQIQQLGLFDKSLVPFVSKLYDAPWEEPTLLLDKQLAGKQVKIELILSSNPEMKISLASYALIIEQPVINHGAMENNGVHSAVLEGRMKVLNWKNYGRAEVEDYRLFASQQQAMDRVLSELAKFRGRGDDSGLSEDSRVEGIAMRLEKSYLTGTPLDHIVQGHARKSQGYDSKIFFPPWVDFRDVEKHGQSLKTLEQFSWQCYLQQFNNPNIMNQKNLESLKTELSSLGFPEHLHEKMEMQMKNNVPEFELNDRMTGTKGQVDFQLFFRQSSQSDFYYLNKFEVMLTEGKGLEKDQSYLIIAPSIDQGKNTVIKYDNAAQAIDVFKKQTGKAELAIGTSEQNSNRMAAMDEGKISFVDKDFSRILRNPPVGQTFWLDRGKGFSASQALNLIEGRAVYRDDMLSKEGAAYKAWMKLDLDGPRDKYMNFNVNQYHDPSYGFDLKEVLERFPFKELANEKLSEKLESSLKNGDRAAVSIEKDGNLLALKIEAVPRYSQLNVFNLEGKSEKREQFLKEQINEKISDKSNTKAKVAGKEQSVGL
ncbi:hypothetical protein [Pedobacter sp. Leaf194]|uniref:hypothetical protein n=1 Tax=Pedobacter sp. Leaf194 TaxID=1736297 RepID=UPI0007026142|nr:hypothetical protein [Pedobacter sp. Leaf194]KQS36835.1 hypothetical protein ASG14_07295 [Pedobacter sp. Leaf194]